MLSLDLVQYNHDIFFNDETIKKALQNKIVTGEKK